MSEATAKAMVEEMGRSREDAALVETHLRACALYERLRAGWRAEALAPSKAGGGETREGLAVYDMDEDEGGGVMMRAGDVTLYSDIDFEHDAVRVYYELSQHGTQVCSGDLVVRPHEGRGFSHQHVSRAGASVHSGAAAYERDGGSIVAILGERLVDDVLKRFIALRAKELVDEPARARAGRDQRVARAESTPKNPTGRYRTIALYKTGDVRDAMDGMAHDGPQDSGAGEAERMRAAIVSKGEAGAARRLIVAGGDVAARIDAIAAQAPHLAQAMAFVRDHATLSQRTGTPLRMPPLLLVGNPGTSKSWTLRRLAEALDVPFRKSSMTSTSLSEAFTGSHPSYRNASAGLVARALLKEEVANPLITVDELDKPAATSGGDPMRPFYTLLDPENACAFVDDFLAFPIDASHVLWAATANDVSEIPPAIMSRFHVVEVPDIAHAQMRVIVEGMHASANSEHAHWFDDHLDEDVVEALCAMTPRKAKMGIAAAMARAASAGRRHLVRADLPVDRAGRKFYGFNHGP